MDLWTPIADAMAIVWRVYRAELHRDPDPDCAGWVAEIATGRMTEAQMIAAVRQSPEWAALHQATPGPEPGPQPPTPAPSLTPWPRIGLSYYASLTDPRLDLAGFFSRLRDAGATLTRTWLMDAWAVNQGGAGQYDGFVPFVRDGNGKWDLYTVRADYCERLRAYVETANAHGVVPQLTGLELYTWSARKAGMLWVPDQSQLWMQNNRQGIVYRNDDAFTTLATTGNHGWLRSFYGTVVRTLDGLVWAVELGNEMPEKELHYRLRDLWRQAGYTGPIAINRHEDTPGQYSNMKIGRDFDQIAFHGRRDIAYLDEVFEREPVYPTFRAFYSANTHEPARITLSSDGCRKSTNVGDVYDYAALGEVFRDALARGMNIEHQSALKIRSFVEGRIDLADLEVSWLRSLQ